MIGSLITGKIVSYSEVNDILGINLSNIPNQFNIAGYLGHPKMAHILMVEDTSLLDSQRHHATDLVLTEGKLYRVVIDIPAKTIEEQNADIDEQRRYRFRAEADDHYLRQREAELDNGVPDYDRWLAIKAQIRLDLPHVI